MRELDPFDRLLEKIKTDRMMNKFPEKPIDPTLQSHFMNKDSYIRHYTESKYHFSQRDLTSFWQPEERIAELMMKDDSIF